MNQSQDRVLAYVENEKCLRGRKVKGLEKVVRAMPAPFTSGTEQKE